MRMQGLQKQERLYLNREVEALFASRQSFVCFPFRVVYRLELVALSTDEASLFSSPSILVSVPKKRLRHAVDRNRMKRLTREAYRLQKSSFIELLNGDKRYVLHIGLLYLSKELIPSVQIHKAMSAIFQRFITIIKDQDVE